MDLTLTIRGREASVSGISALICGNSGYRVIIDYDAEWESVTRSLYVEIIRTDGTQTRLFPVPNNAVDLPAFHNAEALRMWLSGGALTSSKAELLCGPCITDGKSHAPPDQSDLYNMVMQFVCDSRRGAPDAVREAELAAIMAHTAEPVPLSEYRAAIASGCVSSRLHGTVTLETGASYPFTESDIIANSFSVCANAMTGDFLLPGGVPSAELSCTFAGSLAELDLSGAEITANYEVMTHLCRWYSLPIGKFTVYEPQRNGSGQMQITAYDAMMKLDSLPVSMLEIEENTAYTPQEILLMIAEAGGIPYTGNTDAFVNKDCTFILSALDDTIDTLRDLLMYTAQVLNCCAYIARDGALMLARIAYKDADMMTGKRQIVQSQISAKRYQLYVLHTIIQYKENGVTVSRSLSPKTYWADGVYAELPEDPLLRVLQTTDPEEDIGAAVAAVKNDLDFAAYFPAEIVQVSDPSADLMDWITYETRSGTVSAPLTAYQWTFHGGMTAEACGTEAIAGIKRTQAEKIASGERTSGDIAWDNMARLLRLVMLQKYGNAYAQRLKNADLSHFTYAELSERFLAMTHEEMAAYTHEQLAEKTHAEI